MSQKDALVIVGDIQRVRITRWRDEQPAEYDRANPHLHPDCLGVFEVQADGTRKVLFEREPACR